MDHSKIAWNASDEFDIADVFLSMPKPNNRYLSKASRFLWNIIDFTSRICQWLEPREYHLTERILEVPFVLQRLPSSGHILDIGCMNSHLALQLACMGYKITALDVRTYPFRHPNLKICKEDISCAKLEEASYDCAICISTVEHVGLGHYGDARGISDRSFIDALARFVKPNGSIFITVPFGLRFESHWYRVYNSETLEYLIEGYGLVSKLFARRLSLLEWQLCLEDEVASVASTDLPMQGVALVEIRK